MNKCSREAFITKFYEDIRCETRTTCNISNRNIFQFIMGELWAHVWLSVKYNRREERKKKKIYKQGGKCRFSTSAPFQHLLSTFSALSQHFLSTSAPSQHLSTFSAPQHLLSTSAPSQHLSTLGAGT
jgi:hypothetical protein